ncbi:MAG TPA: DUF255 domain-containing protein [Tepidisphaeraceae bacterium]
MEHEHTNRLIYETSPYLLQHAHNPVDWYAWGPEAFEAARTQNKPIFVSVGYSTCYWCHVMERESFENADVARVMNEHCINIKVDREERPDVDQLYMLAVQVLTRHGGWPMSVFLTPDLRPFYGGTYFPAADRGGRPGFVTVVKAISEAYHKRKEDVDRSADDLARILRQISEPAGADQLIEMNQRWIDRLIERSADDYDPRLGGFGSAPKFPRETLLELLLTYCGEGGSGISDFKSEISNPKSQTSNLKSEILKRVVHTLDAMAAGGIRDQLGGGFHRYSTDAEWLVPHFEIMLYDNAMLAWSYAEAYRQTEELRHAKVARGICDFILREMTSPAGAFYTALDAEVDAMEGGSYLWTAEQVEEVLGKEDAKIFNAIYGLDQGPNFADPHHGSGVPDQNVLFMAKAIDGQDEDYIAELRQKLYAARKQRKQPMLDTKIITSWNALMIRGLAHAGNILQEPRYLDAAGKAADFLLRAHRMADGGLFRTSRDGKAKYAGFLDDYAFLVQALLSLRDATGEEKWKDQAAGLAAVMQEKFLDAERGGFFFNDATATDLIVRQKTASDSPLPSGNASAALAMMELGKTDIARDTLRVFARQLRDQAEGMSSLVQAALVYVRQQGALRVEAQEGATRMPTPEEVAAEVVQVRAGFATPKELHVEVNVLEPFHINAHETIEGLVGTTITAAEGTAEIEKVEYPPGEEQAFAFADEKLRVYSGKVVIVVRFKEAVQPGAPLRLRLTYQACDENSCLTPVTQTLEMRMG